MGVIRNEGVGSPVAPIAEQLLQSLADA
jgi:hypothetical protein